MLFFGIWLLQTGDVEETTVPSTHTEKFIVCGHPEIDIEFVTVVNGQKPHRNHPLSSQLRRNFTTEISSSVHQFQSLETDVRK